MPITEAIVVGLLLGALVPALAYAQNGGTVGDGDVRSTLRATRTVRSGRVRPPSQRAAPATTNSVKRGKGKPGGPTIDSICIGCGAK